MGSMRFIQNRLEFIRNKGKTGDQVNVNTFPNSFWWLHKNFRIDLSTDISITKVFTVIIFY